MSSIPSATPIPDDSYKINPLALHIYKMFNQELVEKYEFLKIQLEIATESHGKQFKFTEPQRRKLVNAGIPVRAHLEELCEIMKPATLLKWHRDQIKKKWDYSDRAVKKAGRPHTSESTTQLVLDMAEANPWWGCRMISGELKKLGHNVSHTTVYNILIAHDMPTDPQNKGLSWKQFIQSHMDTIWACDFFTEEVWTVGGLQTYYVLFYIHLATRKVYIPGITTSPNSIWMKQQARNFSMYLDDHYNGDKSKTYLIHDGDILFKPFDSVLKEELRIVRTPKQSPWCNGYAERFVREARGTLRKLILIGEGQLLSTVRKIEKHHNNYRPHQGLNNTTPIPYQYPGKPAMPPDVKCHSELGGLLNHYYVDKVA
jgi:putative transposase